MIFGGSSAALAILLLATGGCRKDDGPPLVRVYGRVTLDGQPLGLKTLRFIPEPGTIGSGGGATTAQDGSYALIAVRPGATADVPGIPPGSYRVVVSEPMFPIQQPPPQAPDGFPAPAVGPLDPDDPQTRAPSAIPPMYTAAETTKLRCEVPRTGGEIHLELSSRP